jgi:hypothetical protein
MIECPLWERKVAGLTPATPTMTDIIYTPNINCYRSLYDNNKNFLGYLVDVIDNEFYDQLKSQMSTNFFKGDIEKNGKSHTIINPDYGFEELIDYTIEDNEKGLYSELPENVHYIGFKITTHYQNIDLFLLQKNQHKANLGIHEFIRLI